MKHRLGNNGLSQELTSCARVSDSRHGTFAQALAIRAADVQAAAAKAAEKAAAEEGAKKAAAENAAVEKAAAEKTASEKAAAVRTAAQKAAAEKAAAEKAAAAKAADEQVAAAKAAAEKAAAEKAIAKEKRGRGKAAKRDSAAQPSFFPEHWSAPTGAGSTSALSLVHIQDGGILEALKACLEGTDIGCCGNDQKYYDGPYENLVLKEAWRVENTGLWQSYQGAQTRAMALEPWVKESFMNEKIRPELYRSSGKLPGGLVQSCNEVL